MQALVALSTLQAEVWGVAKYPTVHRTATVKVMQSTTLIMLELRGSELQCSILLGQVTVRKPS